MMDTATQQQPALGAIVQRAGSRHLHYLTLDGREISSRGSKTRRYTHVLAVDTAAHGWTAWSWHLSEAAAHAAARAVNGAPTRVVEVREVTS